MAEAKRLDAIPYDVKDVELGHPGKECSFEAILKKYKLTGYPALVLLGRIVNGADTDNTLYHQPEGPGLEAIAEGFRTTMSTMRRGGSSKTRSMRIAVRWLIAASRTAISWVDARCYRLSTTGGHDHWSARAIDNRPMSSCSQALFRSTTEVKLCLAPAPYAVQPIPSTQLPPLFRPLSGP